MNHKRIRWACRRGMLELDMYFLPFYDQQFEHLSDAEKEQFTVLLEQTDADLNAWVVANNPCKIPSMQPLIERIRTFKQSLTSSA